MVLGLLSQLQIFSQWYLIELLGLLTGLGILELWHLIYPRFLTEFAYWSSPQTSLLWNFTSDIWLFSSFISNRWLRVVLDRKSSSEYPVNAPDPQGPILGPTFFLLYINDLLDVIYDIAIYGDDTTLP